MRDRGFNRLFGVLARFVEKRWALAAVVASAALLAGGYLVSTQLKIGDLDPGAPELRADSRYNRDNAYITSHYTLSSDTFAVIVKTEKEGCLKYQTLVEADRLAWALQQVPGVQTTASLTNAVRQITAGSNEGAPKWLTIARNQDVLNYGAQQASVNNPDLFNTDCSVMPVIAYLSDHRAETLDRVVQASSEFAAAHSTPERQFLLAAGSAGIEAATNIVVRKAWVQMLLLVYAAVIVLCFITFRSWRAVVVAVVPLVITSVLCEALMVALGIGVKVATLPVIALGVGIGVDYALYLLSVQLAQQRVGVSLADAYRSALQFTGKVVVLVGVTLAAGVATWALSPIKFQADMGVLLAFMFVWNMVGAVVLIPALSYYLLPSGRAQAETPMSYIAPVKDLLFCMSELAGLEQVASLPGFEDAGVDTAQAVLEECASFNEGVIAPLNFEGDKNPSSWKDGAVTTTPGFKAGVPPIRRWRLAGPAAPGRVRRPGPAEDDRRGLHRDQQQREPELRAVPAADRRCDRGPADRGLRRTQADLPAAHGLGRVDRHDEPDRAAGRQRPGAGAHARRAASRRQLQDLRHQDLHHLWRARHGGEHRPPRAGPRDRRARRREGHQPVRGAEVHGRGRRQPRCAQRRALRQHRAQARHQGQPDRGAAVRRRWRRRGLPRRRGEPRPRDHVHHDERRALRGRRAGHRDRRTRLPAGRGLCQGPRAGPPGGRLAAGGRRDHPPPRRQAHAADDALAGRRLPRGGDLSPRRPTTPRMRTPTPRCASRARRSTNSWCRWSRAFPPR